jgi:hypothetical protein
MPALRAMAGRTNKWDKTEPEELAATLLECFCLATIWLHKSDRRDHLAGALMRQTYHLLYEQYSRRWATNKSEILRPYIPGNQHRRWEALQGTTLNPAYSRVELRHARAACIAHLHALQRLGIISPDEKLIIIGTYLSDQSVKQYAISRLLSPEACKKQRQRALAKISSYHRNIPNGLSPNTAKGGLFVNGGAFGTMKSPLGSFRRNHEHAL